MRLETDLNRRERERYSKALRSLSENAKNLADAIEAADDNAATAPMLMLAMDGMLVNELLGIFSNAIRSEVKKNDPDEFDRLEKAFNKEV